MSPDDVRQLLRKHIAARYESQAEAARRWGVAPPFVSMVLSGGKRPTDVMLEDMGIERIVIYRRRIDEGGLK